VSEGQTDFKPTDSTQTGSGFHHVSHMKGLGGLVA